MLIEASRRGDYPFTDLIKAYPVAEMDAAVKAISDGSVVKAVITWD
jgi:aryl-alcohol dehydrogenase